MCFICFIRYVFCLICNVQSRSVTTVQGLSVCFLIQVLSTNLCLAPQRVQSNHQSPLHWHLPWLKIPKGGSQMLLNVSLHQLRDPFTCVFLHTINLQYKLLLHPDASSHLAMRTGCILLLLWLMSPPTSRPLVTKRTTLSSHRRSSKAAWRRYCIVN